MFSFSRGNEMDGRLLIGLCVLALVGCTSNEPITAEVLSMDADGVRIAVHAFPGATVGVQGRENATAGDDGVAEVHVALSDAVTGHLTLTAHAHGLFQSRAGMVDVTLPRTVEEAEHLGGHVVRVTLAGTTDSPAPDRIEVLETATRTAATRRWTYARVASDGWLELPLEGDPGTSVTCGASTVTLDAGGAGTLRLWAPDLAGSLEGEAALRETLTTSLEGTLDGRGPAHVEIELEASVARLLRLAFDHLSLTRPLFSTAPAPSATTRGLVVLPGDRGEDALAANAGRLDATDRISVASDRPGDSLERCEYTDGAGNVSFPHYATGYEIVTRDARTGAEIGRTTLPSTPQPCPSSLDPDLHEVRDRPPTSQVLGAVGMI
jgi:hypothetical protein